MDQVSFDVTAAEAATIKKIVDRALAEASERGQIVDRLSLTMDLTACHANGCPMNFDKLLNAPVGTFGHDVWGISRFIDRDTGELTDFFLPRCALPEPVDSEAA